MITFFTTVNFHERVGEELARHFDSGGVPSSIRCASRCHMAHTPYYELNCLSQAYRPRGRRISDTDVDEDHRVLFDRIPRPRP